jgi:hypothetical protein
MNYIEQNNAAWKIAGVMASKERERGLASSKNGEK